MNALRLFIALPFSASVKERCAALQKRGRQRLEGLKWVDPEKMHLTLLFLGKVQPLEQVQIEAIIREVSGGFAPFILELSGLGVFPDLKSPKALWVGITEIPALTALQEALARYILKMPFPVETRPFRPHLTLGRIRGHAPLDALRRWIKEEEGLQVGVCQMASVCLMESRLTTQGACYFTRLEAPLKQEP